MALLLSKLNIYVKTFLAPSLTLTIQAALMALQRCLESCPLWVVGAHLEQ